MNDHNKLVSGVEATANPAPSKGRRRLVKGAIFAVPAIVTLNRASAAIDPQNSIWCEVATKQQQKMENGQPVYEQKFIKKIGVWVDDKTKPVYETVQDEQDSCLLSLQNRGS